MVVRVRKKHPFNFCIPLVAKLLTRRKNSIALRISLILDQYIFGTGRHSLKYKTYAYSNLCFLENKESKAD